MQRNSWFLGIGLLAGMALVLALCGAAWAAEPPPAPAYQLVRPVNGSDFWLGLACNPASEALRAQLGLAEAEGLVVERVMPDSAAAKAGIKQFDIVLKFDGKPTGTLMELIYAVDAAKEKEVTIELLRGGKSIQIKATPQKRPEGPQPGPPLPVRPNDPNWEAWRKHLDQFRHGEPGGAPWRFRFWGPGVIVPPYAKAQPPQAAPHPPLPGNLSVAITKAGEDPAKIVVKRDDEKWEVTEESLDQLPDDVRPHVERMLGGAQIHPGVEFGPHDFNLVPQPMPHWKGRPQGGMEPWMDEVNRRMEEIRRMIDDMRGQHPRLKEDPAARSRPRATVQPRRGAQERPRP